MTLKRVTRTVWASSSFNPLVATISSARTPTRNLEVMRPQVVQVWVVTLEIRVETLAQTSLNERSHSCLVSNPEPPNLHAPFLSYGMILSHSSAALLETTATTSSVSERLKTSCGTPGWM